MVDFDAMQVIDDDVWATLCEMRASDPKEIITHAHHRKRRRELTVDGRLVILAADHPARMVVDVNDEDGQIGNRRDYLARILQVLQQSDVDGVMGTPDVLEDLFGLDAIMVEGGASSVLDHRVIVGCMNRGGLSSAAFELDDRFTAYDAAGLQSMYLDGGKMMVRLDLQDPASLDTLEACAQAVDGCIDNGMTAFVEAFLVNETEDGYEVDRSPRALMKAVSVAAALGDSSLHTWLKLPYCEGYEQVAGATSLPILMLGGAARDDQHAVLEEFASGMAAAPNVRGCLVGRNVLYADDPGAMGRAVVSVVHEDADAISAMERAHS
jgi:DhnA family fructose-bisphosphate aldolase class Ia